MSKQAYYMYCGRVDSIQLHLKLSDIHWINHICWPFHDISLSSIIQLDNFGTKVHICIRLVETSLLYVLWTSWHHSVTSQIENWVSFVELTIFVSHFMVLCIVATIDSITLKWRYIFIWHLLRRAYYMYWGQVDIIQLHLRLKIECHSLN